MKLNWLVKYLVGKLEKYICGYYGSERLLLLFFMYCVFGFVELNLVIVWYGYRYLLFYY